MAEILQCPIHIAKSHGVQVISNESHVGDQQCDPIWIAYNGETHYDSVFTRGFQFEPPSRPIPANQQAQPEPQGAQQSCTTHAVSDPASSVKSPEVVQLHLSHTLFPETNDPADAFNRTNANSWVFLTANVTSFSSQHTALLEIPFDIAAIQETRHTIKSQNQFSLTLKKAGFGVIWGKHLPFRAAKSSGHTSTGLNGRPGGVAVIARSHIPLQFISPGDMEVRKRLYHSCRWVHAVVTYGNCKQMIHIFSVYGFIKYRLLFSFPSCREKRVIFARCS